MTKPTGAAPRYTIDEYNDDRPMPPFAVFRHTNEPGARDKESEDTFVDEFPTRAEAEACIQALIFGRTLRHPQGRQPTRFLADFAFRLTVAGRAGSLLKFLNETADGRHAGDDDRKTGTVMDLRMGAPGAAKGRDRSRPVPRPLRLQDRVA